MADNDMRSAIGDLIDYSSLSKRWRFGLVRLGDSEARLLFLADEAPTQSDSTLSAELRRECTSR